MFFSREKQRRYRPRLVVEPLEDRLTPSVISFGSAYYSVSESSGSATITVFRDSTAQNPESV
jgi:hypothetical protein